MDRNGEGGIQDDDLHTAKIFVTNMDGSIDQEVLEPELRHLFEQHGVLRKLTIKKSKDRKYCFAFLEYETEQQAEQAIKALDQHELKGKKMKVRKDKQNEGCFNCQKPGHFARDCPDAAKETGRQPDNMNARDTRDRYKDSREGIEHRPPRYEDDYRRDERYQRDRREEREYRPRDYNDRERERDRQRSRQKNYRDHRREDYHRQDRGVERYRKDEYGYTREERGYKPTDNEYRSRNRSREYRSRERSPAEREFRRRDQQRERVRDRSRSRSYRGTNGLGKLENRRYSRERREEDNRRRRYSRDRERRYSRSPQ